MAKALPSILTNRKASHEIIAKLQSLMIRYQGWKDARSALKSRRKLS